MFIRVNKYRCAKSMQNKSKIQNIEGLIPKVYFNKIQLDLFNNTLVYLKKSVYPDSLETLRGIIKRRINNEFINNIVFITPSHRIRRRRDHIKLFQKKITEYIETTINFDYYSRIKDFLNFQEKTKKNIQVSLFNEIVLDKINTLQYRGNKSQIIDFLKPYFQQGSTVLDLMAGSQSVGLAIKTHSNIITNDVQYYSYVLSKAFIENNRYSKLKVIPKEIINPASEFKLFQKYFSGIYFTKEQCIEIDNIRATIEKFRSYNITLHFCYLACLLQSLDLVARTAGHFDGALNIYTEKVKVRERKSIYVEFCRRIEKFSTIKSNYKNLSYNLPAEELLNKIEGVDIIYIDPPYNHRQYSRYYHILETCAKYDENIRKDTKGLYPEHEFKSDFCYKDKVEDAFRRILQLSIGKAKKSILISYSNIGLISRNKLLEICKEFDLNAKVIEKDIKYTRQKTSNSNKKEKELLYILSVENKSWIADFLPDNKKTLVITSCSKKKVISEGKIKSIIRYNGQMFNMTKTFVKKNNYDLLIISAKYGLLKSEDKIENYELRLENQKQAIQLKAKVLPLLKTILKKEKYERIIVIMGRLYRTVIEDILDERFIFLESKNGIFDYLSKLSLLNNLQ